MAANLKMSKRSAMLSVAAGGAALVASQVLFVVPFCTLQRPVNVPSQLQAQLFQTTAAAYVHRIDTASVAAGGFVLAAAVLCMRVVRQTRPGASLPTRRVQVSRTAAMVPPRDRTDAVHLTGSTLAAAMKMRCEITGADYAIFWINVNGSLVIASEYVTPTHRAALKAAGKSRSFAEASDAFFFDTSSFTQVSAVYNLGEPMFIADAPTADDFKRKELAVEYGVKSICFVPVEAGVLEFGTTQTWSDIPYCPIMPKKEVREAFENLGAGYVMFWGEKDGEFRVRSDYVSEERQLAFRNSRGDDKTFCSESRSYHFSASGDGFFSLLETIDEPIYISATEMATSERADLAKEFGIKGMHFIPVKDGVIECGIHEGNLITGNTLQAAMKLRCDLAGSGYAVYWTEVDGEFVVSGDYVTPARQEALAKRDNKVSFAEASKQVKVPAAGSDPIAQCARMQEPVYIQDPCSCETFLRKDLVDAHDIASICFKHVKGGVLEFGTSRGPCTATWTEMPIVVDLPKEEMKRAFDDLEMDYVIFWCYRGDYVVGGLYVKPEHKRAVKNQWGTETSFADVSQLFKLPADGDNYVWQAALSGQPVIVKNPSHDDKLGEDGSLKRSTFAAEFKITEIRFVPFQASATECGVLEFGKSAYKY